MCRNSSHYVQGNRDPFVQERRKVEMGIGRRTAPRRSVNVRAGSKYICGRTRFGHVICGNDGPLWARKGKVNAPEDGI